MSELEASISCSPQCAETDSNKNTGDITPETVQNTISNNSQGEEALQSDSDPLEDLLTDKFCHVCEATLLYESQRVSHYEGKKHAQRVKLFLQNKNTERSKQGQECKDSLGGVSSNPDKFCELCNMVFSSPTVAKSHYEGKVHAKNVRKASAPPHGTSAPVLGSAAPPVRPTEVTVQKQTGQEQKDTSGLGEQEVNVDDPDKYCALCKATFNNPVVAQQHYGGRKHQRNQTRQQMMDQLGNQSEHASALICPICSLTFSSIEMYQAHIQGNKHFVKEKKVKELCQSQKKVYDSYQDELADYIQVQKARGLEPKAGLGTGGQTSKSLSENIKVSPQPEEIMPHPALMPQRPPPAGFPQPHWHPQIPYQVDHFGFRMRGPVSQYPPEYMSHPRPPFKHGKLLKRRRGPESYSSSSSSDSSSYTSSSSSTSSSSGSSSDSSSSYESRRKRRLQRKMRMQRKWRHQEEECDVDKKGREEEKQGECKRKRKGDRRGSVEREEDREDRKWKARRRKERSSCGDEQSRRKRRPSKKSRRHGDHAKRPKEEELMVRGEEEVTNEEAQGEMNEYVDERTDLKDGKQKPKKDKKVKEKVNQEDNRTEEERLWDETILGVF